MWRAEDPGEMAPETILGLFDELIAELIDALSELEDWGPSGGRPDQYSHDVVADDIMRNGLLDAGFRVLSEESGMSGEPEGLLVVVDPIDGSTNASRAIPWYAASLCAVDDEGPLAADVVNLADGDRFRAIRDMGAIGEEEELAPSGCEQLADALVAFSGLPPKHGGWSQYRTYGAAALDICGVAMGTFDAFVDVDAAHGVWDYLGAVLVCQEAGAVVGERDGRDLLTLDPAARRGPIAAATSQLFDEVAAMIVSWELESARGS